MKNLLIVIAILSLNLMVWGATYSVENVTWTAATYVSVSGNTMTKNAGAQNTWDAGAFSVQSIASGLDGYVESTAQETTTHRMFGLSATNPNNHWSSISFAVYFIAGGSLYIYEGGSGRGYFSTYTTGDVYRVAREDTAIKYYKNGVLFYTSTLTTSATLYADTSLYEIGSTIANVKMGVEVVPEPSSMFLLALAFVFFFLKKK